MPHGCVMPPWMMVWALKVQVVVSLSKKLHSHCSSPPSCINGDLALTGEANANSSTKEQQQQLSIKPGTSRLTAQHSNH